MEQPTMLNIADHDFTGPIFRAAWQESIFRQAKGDLAYVSATPEEIIRKKRIGTLIDVVAGCVRRMDGAQKAAPWEEGWLDGKMRELALAILPAEFCEDRRDRAVMLVVANTLVIEVVERLNVEAQVDRERSAAELEAVRNRLREAQERVVRRRQEAGNGRGWRPPGAPGTAAPASVVDRLPEPQVPRFLRPDPENPLHRV